jgi:hypothetical protein
MKFEHKNKIDAIAAAVHAVVGNGYNKILQILDI